MSGESVLWWVFVSTILGVVVLSAGLAVAMIVAQNRLRRLHQTHARQLLTIQEEERARVARELHDDAVQRLTVFCQELDSLSRSDPFPPTERREIIGAFRDELDKLAGDLRALAHDLHPAVIDQSGLGAALVDLADQFGRTQGLRVEVSQPAELPSLEAARATSLYRIVQEALQNVVRHAGATTAQVTARIGRGILELEIVDHGKGFRPGSARISGGIGLLTIQERARLAGGRVSIHSQPGEGTRILVEVPVADPSK